MVMSVSQDSDDYRRSHLRKGADYEASLATAPFDRYMAKHESRLVAWFLDRYFPGGVPAYLDFACGTGRITTQVEPRAARSYAVDVSERMIAEARQKCQKTIFILQDITRQALQLANVDLVTSFRFFGNAQDALRQEALAALHAVLRPRGSGGSFIPAASRSWRREALARGLCARPSRPHLRRRQPAPTGSNVSRACRLWRPFPRMSSSWRASGREKPALTSSRDDYRPQQLRRSG
jgi:SAM-dependent methyltransferase